MSTVLLSQVHEVVLAVESPVESPAPEAEPEAQPLATPSAPSSSVSSWKTTDVGLWLTSLELPMHVDAFKSHSVDGFMLLVLTEEDLYKTLGVSSPIHRKKIMLAIGELRKAFLSAK